MRVDGDTVRLRPGSRKLIARRIARFRNAADTVGAPLGEPEVAGGIGRKRMRPGCTAVQREFGNAPARVEPGNGPIASLRDPERALGIGCDAYRRRVGRAKRKIRGAAVADMLPMAPA